MDDVTQFLNRIAYKFPKGYPDMNDANDILILENELKSMGIDLKEAKHTKDVEIIPDIPQPINPIELNNAPIQPEILDINKPE